MRGNRAATPTPFRPFQPPLAHADPTSAPGPAGEPAPKARLSPFTIKHRQRLVIGLATSATRQRPRARRPPGGVGPSTIDRTHSAPARRSCPHCDRPARSRQPITSGGKLVRTGPRNSNRYWQGARPDHSGSQGTAPSNLSPAQRSQSERRTSRPRGLEGRGAVPLPPRPNSGFLRHRPWPSMPAWPRGRPHSPAFTFLDLSLASTAPGALARHPRRSPTPPPPFSSAFPPAHRSLGVLGRGRHHI